MKNDIITLILMGGQNKRMNGQHKAFLDFNGESFLDHIIKEMSAFSPVVLSVNDKEKFKDLEYPMIVDEVKGIGPMGGIYSALKVLDCDYLFITACDMPFMTAEFASYMYEKMKSLNPQPVALILSDGDGKFSPLGGIYSKKLLPHIEEMLAEENYRLGKLLKTAGAFIIPIHEIPFSENVMRNINTPEEYHNL